VIDIVPATPSDAVVIVELYERMEWTADVPNTEAQRFYAGLGAELNQMKLVYRLPIGYS